MYYIGYYTPPGDVRISSPAANAKILSIAQALGENNIKVNILSTCTVASKKGFIPGRTLRLFENVKCRQYALYGTRPGLIRKIQHALANTRIFLTLLLRAKKGENVLMYHAIERSKAVLLAKKIRKFRLILEVEEVYANASQLRQDYIEKEQRILRAADAFIFPTTLLNDAVNHAQKPYAIIHGTYQAEPELEKPAEDGRVHVVYAGTLDPRKGGAMAAASAAKYLDEQYHLHILGFGNDALVRQMQDTVQALSRECKCKITYDGCLTGDEYKRFIQRCHIGLSTQNPNDQFNDTSFPSKILSYMANGLQVVSVRIPVVETSAVHPYMHYYDQQTPEGIAKAIMSVDMESRKGGRAVIRQLNEEFTQQVKSVL